MTEATIQGLALPRPDGETIKLSFAAGASLAEMIDCLLPGLTDHARALCQVTLVSASGMSDVLDMALWRRIFPRAGVTVLVRLVPGNDGFLRGALSIAIAVGATALGQLWAPSIALAIGLPNAVVAAGITAGVTIAGGLLLNALIPVESEGRNRPAYLISGFKNRWAPEEPVVSVLGTHRYAPVYAVPPYIEIVGDKQYVRAMFDWGYGPLQLTNLRLGKTPIGNFANLQIEHRFGYASDLPHTLVTEDVIEDRFGADLTRDWPIGPDGEPTGAEPVHQPVVRQTATDVTQVNLIYSMPQGMVRYGTGFFDSGQLLVRTVKVRVRFRQVGVPGADWTDPIFITFSGKKSQPFFRQRRLALPSRGTWEVEQTRLTNAPAATDTQTADRVTWLALQSIRPEYPLKSRTPRCTSAIRMLATAQTNGNLDDFNGLATLLVKSFGSAEGDEDDLVPSSRPADLFRHVLQGPQNVFPLDDGKLDIEGLADWFQFCIDNDLKYDRVHEGRSSRKEMLSVVAAAGRAKWTEINGKWSVIIDRPQTLVVDHLHLQNSREYKWQRPFWTPPHAFRVPFNDASSDYETRERLVPWPGYVGDITITEKFETPGKTDPAEVFLETRRRQYELMLRPERITVTQDGTLRPATRGDLLKTSRLTFNQGQASLKVTGVRDQHLSLDGPFTMLDGQAYAIRFLVPPEDEGEPWSSEVRPLVSIAGTRRAVAMAGSGAVPSEGDVVMLGLAGEESADVIVSEVETGSGNTSVLHVVAAAPEIDALLALDEVPAWDGRVGDILAADTTPPAAPRITAITGHYTDDVIDGLTVLLEPAETDIVTIDGYEVRHRLAGSGVWLGPVADGSGSVDLTGYAVADEVELQPRALSVAGVPSVYGPTVTAIVKPIPLAIPSAPTAVLTPGLGWASIAYTAPSEDVVRKLRFYVGSTAVFSAATKKAELDVVANATGTVVLGDGTRVNVVADPAMSTAWLSFTGGWAYDAGNQRYNHTAAAGLLRKTGLALPAAPTGKWRLAMDVVNYSAGSMTPFVTDGAQANGAAITANGTHLQTIALAGVLTQFGVTGGTNFAGGTDNWRIYPETVSCLPQGVQYFFVTAVNAEEGESLPLELGAATIP